MLFRSCHGWLWCWPQPPSLAPYTPLIAPELEPGPEVRLRLLFDFVSVATAVAFGFRSRDGMRGEP